MEDGKICTTTILDNMQNCFISYLRRNTGSLLSDKLEMLLSHPREQVCAAQIHWGVVSLQAACNVIGMHVVIFREKQQHKSPTELSIGEGGYGKGC